MANIKMEQTIQKILEYPATTLFSLNTFATLVDVPNILGTKDKKVEVVTTLSNRHKMLQELSLTYYPKSNNVQFTKSQEFVFGRCDFLILDLILGVDSDMFAILEFWKMLENQAKPVPKIILVSPVKKVDLVPNSILVELQIEKNPYENRYFWYDIKNTNTARYEEMVTWIRQYMEVPELTGTFLVILPDNFQINRFMDRLSNYHVEVEVKPTYTLPQPKTILLLTYEIADLVQIDNLQVTFDSLVQPNFTYSSKSLADIHSYKSEITCRMMTEAQFVRQPDFVVVEEDEYRMALKSYLLEVSYPIAENVDQTIRHVGLISGETITEAGLFALLSPLSVINSALVFNSKASFSMIVISSLMENGPYFEYSLKEYDQDNSDYSYEVNQEIREARLKFEGETDIDVYVNIYNSYVQSDENVDVWFLENRINKDRWYNMIETINFVLDLVESFNLSVTESLVEADMENIRDAYQYYRMNKVSEGNLYRNNESSLYSFVRYGKISRISQKLPEQLTALILHQNKIMVAI